MQATIPIYQFFHYTWFLVNLMAALLVISIITPLFFLVLVQPILGHCPAISQYCPGDRTPIRFPFSIQGAIDTRCGYLGVDLACNNQNHTIIHLPHSGDFVVTSIDYMDQSLMIDDPNGCPLSRLSNFTPLGTPFYSEAYNYTFANCTSKLLDTEDVLGLTYIPCLSNPNNEVYYIMDDYAYRDYLINMGCLAWTFSIPESWNDNWGDTAFRLKLHWQFPDCKSCESQGGTCIAMRYPDVGCQRSDGRGPSLSAAIRIVLIVMALVWLARTFVMAYESKTRAETRDRNQQNIERLPTNAAGQLSQPGVPGMVGLDAATIESYPKIQIDGIHELPKPNDNTCSICLAEYQLREIIRVLPECNHYFHANCIDQWLKRNAACPICRNHERF